MIVKCKVCGKEFKTTQNRLNAGRGKYCSRECQHKSLKNRVLVKCCVCNKEFEVKKGYADVTKKNYCLDCREKRKEGHDKICPICGKAFHSSHKDAKYCSIKCKSLAMIKSNTIVQKESYAELIIESKKWGTKVALIDIEDIEKCSKLTWQIKYSKITNCFYVVSSKCNKKEVKLHRYLMDCPDNLVVDHINHEPLDNRKQNLRIITDTGNAYNQMKKKTGKSGFNGIVKTKNGKFKALHGDTSLGVYKTIEEAIIMKKCYTFFIIQKETFKAKLMLDSLKL